MKEKTVMYYLYHIPGEKIGVTKNPKNRIEKEQGFKEDEYVILEISTDIDYISRKEIALQKIFGYKIDKKFYKNINKTKMKVNPTEQTSTFPVPISKLKGRLMDNIGLTWHTPQGYSFEINADTIPWILKNAKASYFNDNRCFVYNKAFHEAFSEVEASKIDERIDAVKSIDAFTNIRSWAKERGLYDKGDVKTQYCKLGEEFGELGRAIIKNNDTELKDAIGDMVVVLTNLAHLGGFSIEDCIDSAYDVIKDRKGAMENGSFVKQTL